MTDNNNQPSEVIIKQKEGISAVWLVPIIALLFGAWLIIKAVSERGVFITVQFDNASGIVVGKTEVRYKGLPAGVVTDIDVTDDLQYVDVEIEMLSGTKKLLTEQTLFWYVTADVSFQGVSGLDTILSGSYINVQPDLESDGKPQRHFIALDEEPILDQATPGLHITLQTDKLGSISKKSPVSYKQINVGHVSGYEYDDTSGKVLVSLFIEPDYQHLVKENSRFWNASGFDISGSLTSGIQVKTESLATIVSGGIAFDDSQYEAVMPPAQNGQIYPLHENYQDAEMGHNIELELNWNAGIDRGASILYQGLSLGIVDTFTKINPETRKITALAKVNPRVVPYLTSESQFFVVAPEVDLGGVTNLHNVLKGSHLSLRPSLNGEPQKRFKVYNNKPAYRYDEPGLHLMLRANYIDSIKPGTSIFYRKQKIGSVQAIEDTSSNELLVHIHILENFKHYVTQNTRFWNTSGIRITGGLQNFEVQAHSIQSVLSGGIEIGIKENDISRLAENGEVFTLFDNSDIAEQRVPLTLTTLSSRDIDTNTRIMYRGEIVGSIHEINRQKETVKITAGILPEYQFLLKDQSQFWLVKPNVSITGLSDTDALFGGAYIAVNAGNGQSKNQFTLSNISPAKHISAEGLQLTLTSERGNVVNPGSPISYRGILVGQVDNVSLNTTGDDVQINITIDKEYLQLINNYTRFYNASGITVSGGLGNFSIKTESTDAVLRGGISFYNPNNQEDNQPDNAKVSEGETFTLFNNIDHAEMAGIAIQIHFNEIAGLRSNLNIKYQDQSIGVVSRVVFDENDYGGTVYAFLNDNGRKFAVSGSKFWLAKTELGLVGSTNVNAIIEGGFISVLPGEGERTTEFQAEDIAPVTTELPYGLNLKLLTSKLGSVRVGNPVLYRQVEVGRVIGVDLSSSANKVNVYINIAKRYANLVSAESKFWNTSGFRVDAGIFSGVNIDSESIETLLSGGIAFATPEPADDAEHKPVTQGHNFKLYQVVDTDWQEWAPNITIGK